MSYVVTNEWTLKYTIFSNTEALLKSFFNIYKTQYRPTVDLCVEAW